MIAAGCAFLFIGGAVLKASVESRDHLGAFMAVAMGAIGVWLVWP